jgi:hypothetical protein
MVSLCQVGWHRAGALDAAQHGGAARLEGREVVLRAAGPGRPPLSATIITAPHRCREVGRGAQASPEDLTPMTTWWWWWWCRGEISLSFIYISKVLPEKATLDAAGAIKVNLRETCILLSIEFKSFPSLYLH